MAALRDLLLLSLTRFPPPQEGGAAVRLLLRGGEGRLRARPADVQRLLAGLPALLAVQQKHLVSNHNVAALLLVAPGDHRPGAAGVFHATSDQRETL